MESKKAILDSIEDVKIDDKGKFKYILVKVYDPDDESKTYKHIVRGTAAAEFHDGIYDELTPEIERVGLSCVCVGGGKMEHDPTEKSIKVYGTSQKYGKADHERACKLLKENFKNYDDISIPKEDKKKMKSEDKKT